ncbi:hypothetical protein GQ42DRAFT_171133 [Ramicandelaber brevisporus]|nr:hypothetical protein GQ42DRAFT_171133 [Ramicandelaber brevisporus]
MRLQRVFVTAVLSASATAVVAATSAPTTPKAAGSEKPLGFNADCVRENQGFAVFNDGCNQCTCSAGTAGATPSPADKDKDNTGAGPGPGSGPGQAAAACTMKFCPIYSDPKAQCVKWAEPRQFVYENQSCLCLTTGQRVCFPISNVYMTQPPPGSDGNSTAVFQDEGFKKCEESYGKGYWNDSVSGFKCICGPGGSIYCEVPVNKPM